MKKEEKFYFKDGRAVANLRDLRAVIMEMDLNEFQTHVNSEKNDFANWVEHVMKKKLLAKDLRAVKKKNSILEVLDVEIGLVPSISSVAAHKFIVKEFIWGFIAGLIVGLVLTGVLYQIGAF